MPEKPPEARGFQNKAGSVQGAGTDVAARGPGTGTEGVTKEPETAGDGRGPGTGAAARGPETSGGARESYILEARGVHKTFRPPAGLAGEIRSLFTGRKGETGVKALRGVDLAVRKGEILGLVGESGSGKSTMGRILSALYLPDRGEVFFEGENVRPFSKPARKNFCRKVQFMFQDPASSLNPRLSAFRSLSEGLVVHRIGDRKARRERVAGLMEEVGLDPSLLDRYPHQFSGGQRQRLCLARALSLDPEVLIADEPSSALDVSVQAQIVNLLLSAKAVRGLALVIISHDLALVSLIAQRIAVLYGGLLMEILPRELLGKASHHPYVKALWASAEYSADSGGGLILEGEPPDPQNPPEGCPFHPRCPEAGGRCREEAPALKEGPPGRLVACHFR